MDYDDLRTLYDEYNDFIPIKRQFRNGTYSLLKKELIENVCSDGFNDSEAFRLTDAVKDEFLVELDSVLLSKPEKKLKRSDSITIKPLFYPEKTQQAIDELVSLLQPDHFCDVQKRLSENGMRTGFACLFSGGPGTGKTETAYQIARITGRDIMPVDIAGTKSKWFGESEKQIKDVFNKYRSCVKNCEVTPILLFNEADAVIGKRQLIGENHNGPAQTENAIQNIILQEIENLNGIMIATTNLSANMDAAFERRFLYKIKFEKPDTETRKAIWRSIIGSLSDDEAGILANRYDFSGGQIENIARRSTVHRVLSGKLPALEELLKFCDMESTGRKNGKKLGFTA
jgi:SpoVK/Ycf46/Vps4 family AAA+-type ATPase